MLRFTDIHKVRLLRFHLRLMMREMPSMRDAARAACNIILSLAGYLQQCYYPYLGIPWRPIWYGKNAETMSVLSR